MSEEREFFPLLAKDVKIGMWLQWQANGQRMEEEVCWVYPRPNKHGLILIETEHNPPSNGYINARTAMWEYPDTIMMAAQGREPVDE